MRVSSSLLYLATFAVALRPLPLRYDLIGPSILARSIDAGRRSIDSMPRMRLSLMVLNHRILQVLITIMMTFTIQRVN